VKAKKVSDFYIETKAKIARKHVDFRRQTDSIRRDLNGAITGVAVANDNTFGFEPSDESRRAPSAGRLMCKANTAIPSLIGETIRIG
jgi:hypothetical protein